jgi:putative acetyltransferase
MRSSQVVFRPAIPSDAPAMVEVHFASVQNVSLDCYPADVLRSWSPPPDDKRRAWLADLVAKDTAFCEVAISGDAVVGFCIAIPGQSRLQALYIHPESSGLGIGTGLLRAVEARCRAAGGDVLELNASFNAEGFYRANGYVAIRETTQALADGTTMGAILMSKRLASLV